MLHRYRTRFAVLALAAVVFSQAVRAEEAPKPFVHPLFTDNMVLQRDVKDPIWGWTAPGQEVTVSFQGKSTKAIAGADGKWMARIGPFKAGGPYSLTVTGPQVLTLSNVLVGDVWLCSGQSNMEMGIGIAKDPAMEIQNADYPKIRLYSVPKKISFSPTETVDGTWKVCAPDTVGSGGWGGFSAVAYYFGRELNRKLDVPIGLLHSSWGGTIAEAWTSGESLKKIQDFAGPVANIQQVAEEQRKGSQNTAAAWAKWWETNDKGSAGAAWAQPGFADNVWKELPKQGSWENGPLPGFDGVVWFRKTIELPADWAGKPAMLRLGAIDDRDMTWVNGTPVGAMNDWQAQRNYTIPGGLLRPGKNVIAVRVLDTGGGGGFHSEPEAMKLEAAGVAPIPLGTNWRFQESKPLGQLTALPVEANNSPNTVTVLYNAMIAPLEPFAFKGAIWYQGESNAGRSEQYKTLLPTMIGDWRSHFETGNFPFYIVQLANYMKADDQPPADSGWARLRDAQALTAQTVANSGLAVAIDIGDAADIHPKNKQEVGRRLALNALAQTYGQKVEYSGPVFQAAKVEGNKIRVKFTHAKGLTAKDGKLVGFATAGEDKKWVWADGQIDGDSVVVSSAEVAAPAYVRYGWGNNPAVSLYNGAGLPAVPFRTDKD